MTDTHPKKIDRRVIKTRQAILTAFMELLKSTPYEKINISSLAREADIDRKTFYLHYDSIDSLLEDIMNQKLAAVLAEDDAGDGETLLEFLTRINHAFHRALAEKKDMLKNLSSDAILDATRNVLMKAVLTSPYVTNKKDPERLALSTSFILGGVVGAYRLALSAEEPHPFEEVSEAIEKMSLTYIEALVREEYRES